MKVRFTVRIGDVSTKILVDPQAETDGQTNEEFDGGYHGLNGLRGAALCKAVEKLYGKRCYWFGDSSDRNRGQVFEAIRATKNNSNPGSSSVTNTVTIDVEEGW